MKNKLVLLSVLPFLGGDALAETLLKIKPAKCVTLKQGNTCYQDLKVSWKSDSKGKYCFVNVKNTNPVKCWDNVKNGQFEFEFVGLQSTDYILLKMPEKIPVVKQHFSVKWVYKARPNNRWRLF